jgi:hexulose-6-phosphate isomerase
VKDYRGSGPSGAFVPLLAGDVPWQRSIAELKAIGYDSYLTAELPIFKQFPADGIHQISGVLGTLIAAGE